MLKASSPYVRMNRLQPGNIYSRPAIPPWMTSIRGMNPAGEVARKQFEYTLEQMAVSPFSVNNPDYIKDIREKYRYQGTSYDLLGTVGGIVGAGTGVLLSAGLLKAPEFKGTLNLLRKEAWKKSNWKLSSPTWTGKFQPKAEATHSMFDGAARYIKDPATGKRILNPLFKMVDDHNTLGTSVKGLQEAYKAQETALVDVKNTITELKKTRAGLKDVGEKAAASRQLRALAKEQKVLETQIATAGKNLAKEQLKYANSAEDLARTPNVKVDKLGKAKVAGSVGKVAGVALSGAAVTMSAIGLKQAIEAEDPFHTAWNAVSLTGDTLAFAGNILMLTVVGAKLGAILRTVGFGISVGSSLFTGFMMGQTMGRSLSPEGMKVQEMFAKNLYSGMVQRPISSVASVLTLVGTPLVLEKLSQLNRDNLFGKGIANTAGWMVHNALGNQVRAGLSMLAMRGVNSVTSKIDERLPTTPKDPRDVSFVSSIALYGDLNDNLYGAARYKSILYGLAKGETGAMTQAMAESWGYNKGMYKSIMFDDVREALGWELSPLGNSVFSVVGEMIIDPQNFHEASMRIAQKRTTDAAALLVNKKLEYEYIDMKFKRTSPYAHLFGADGILKFDRTSRQDRIRVISSLISSKLSKGEQGLKEEMSRHLVHTVKGVGTKDVYKKESVTQETQLQSFNRLVDSVLTGQVTLDTQIQQTVLSNYEKYLKLKKKKTTTDDQKRLLKDMKDAFNSLKYVYGRDLDEAVLVHEFTREMNIPFTNKDMQKLYTNYTHLKIHTDLSDAFAQIVTSFSNPTLSIARKVSHYVRMAVQKTTVLNQEQKSKEIIRIREIQKNKQSLIKQSEIEAIKAKNPESKTVEDLINNKVVANTAVEDAMTEELKKSVETEQQRTQALLQDIAVVKAEVTKDIERIDEQRKGVLKSEASKFSNGRMEVYLHDDNLHESEAIIKQYEGTLTKEELDAQIARDNNSTDPDVRANVDKYNLHKNAYLDYIYTHNKNAELRDALVNIKTSLDIFSAAGVQLNDAMIKRFHAYKVFARYVQGYDMVKQSDIHNETINYHTKELQDLEEELKRVYADQQAILDTKQKGRVAGEKHPKKGWKKIYENTPPVSPPLKYIKENVKIKSLSGQKEISSFTQKDSKGVEHKYYVVLVEYAGVQIPFYYQDTDVSFKGEVGRRWYPFYGFTTTKTKKSLNKFSETSTRNFLEETTLKRISDYLSTKTIPVDTKPLRKPDYDKINKNQTNKDIRKSEFLKQLKTVRKNYLKTHKIKAIYTPEEASQLQLNDKKAKELKKKISSTKGTITKNTNALDKITKEKKDGYVSIPKYINAEVYRILREKNYDDIVTIADEQLGLIGTGLTVVDKEGNPVDLPGLKARKDVKYIRNRMLSVVKKMTMEEALVNAVYNHAGMTDLEFLTTGLFKLEKGFKDKWIQARDNTLKRRNLLIDCLTKLSLPPESLHKLLNVQALEKLFTRFDEVILKQKTEQIIPLEDVSMDFIKGSVFASLYQDKKTFLHEFIKLALDQLQKANENIKLSKEAFKGDPIMLSMIEKQLWMFNKNLIKNEAYQFFKHYLLEENKKETDTRLFLSTDVYQHIVPILDIDDKKMYTIPQAIEEYIESPIVQKFAQKIEQEFKDIKRARSKSIIEEGEDSQQLEMFIQDIADITDESKRMEVITRAVEVQAAKRKNREKRITIDTKKAEEKTERQEFLEMLETNIPLLEILTDENVGNLIVSTAFDSKNILNIAYFRKAKKAGLTKEQAVLLLTKALLHGKYVSELGEISYRFRPSMYPKDEQDLDPKNFKNYFQVTKGYSKYGHSKQLWHFAHRLVTSEENKYIKINHSKLIPIRRKRFESNEDFLIRRIMATYSSNKQKHYVEVFAKPTKEMQKHMNKTVVDILQQNLAKYFKDNFGHDDISLLKPEERTYALKEMVKILETLNNKDEIYKQIFESSTEVFNEIITKRKLTLSDTYLWDMANDLRAYENKDVKSLFHKTYITPYDIAKKAILKNKDVREMFVDLLRLSNNEEAQTVFGSLLTIVDDVLYEEHSNKKLLQKRNIVKMEEKQGVFYLIVKEKEKEKSYTLFDLLRKYTMTDLKVFQNLLGYAMAKTPVFDPEHISKVRAEAHVKFIEYMDIYGDSFTKTIPDKQELTDKEDVPERYEYSMLEQMIRVNNVHKDVRNAKKLYNKEVQRIYATTERRLSEYTEDAPNFWELFAYNIFNSTASEETKRYLIEEIFFHNPRIGKGYAALRGTVEKLEKEIETLQKKTLNRKEEGELKRKEIALKNYRKINSNFLFNDFEIEVDGKPKFDFDKFYKFLNNTFKVPWGKRTKENFNLFRQFYNGKADTDVPDITHAWDGSQYVLIKKYYNQQDNFTIETDAGVKSPNIQDETNIKHFPNEYVGEVLFNNDQAIYKNVQEKMSLAFTEEQGKLDLMYANKYGAVIQIENDKRYELVKYRNKYAKALGVQGELLFLTKEQIDSLHTMKRKQQYGERKVALKDEDGNIKGQVFNFINQSKEQKVSAFISDYERITEMGDDIDATVDKLIDFVEKTKDEVYLKGAYVRRTKFRESEYFLKFIKDLKMHQAFIAFIDFIDPERKYNIDLDTIGKYFFNNYYLNKDGDINKIEEYIKSINPALAKQLKEITFTEAGNTFNLLQRIQGAIIKMRSLYKDEIDYNYVNILNREFLNKLDEMHDKIYKVLNDLKKNHKKVYDKYAHTLRPNIREGYLMFERGDEIQQKRLFVKTFSPTITDKYKTIVINPYTENKEKIEEFYNDLHNELDSITEVELAHSLRKQQESNQKRRTLFNQRIKGKYKRLNFGLFWKLRKLTSDSYIKMFENSFQSDNILTETEGLLTPQLKNLAASMYQIYEKTRNKYPAQLKHFMEKLKVRNINSSEELCAAIVRDYTYHIVENLRKKYIKAPIREALEHIDSLYEQKLNQAARMNIDISPEEVMKEAVKIVEDIEKKKESLFPTLSEEDLMEGDQHLTDYLLNSIYGPLLRYEDLETFKETIDELGVSIQTMLFTYDFKAAEVKKDEESKYKTITEVIEASPKGHQEFVRDYIQLVIANKMSMEQIFQNYLEGKYPAEEPEISGEQIVAARRIIYRQRNRIKKYYELKFRDSYETFSLLTSHVLEKNEDYYKFFIEYLNPADAPDVYFKEKQKALLGGLGLTTDDLKILLDKKNLYEFRYVVLSKMSPKQAYAFSHIVNITKELFLTEHYRKLAEAQYVKKEDIEKYRKWSWSRAVKDFETIPRERKYELLEAIEATKTFEHNAWDNYIIDQAMKGNQVISQVLHAVKSRNDKLGLFEATPKEPHTNVDFKAKKIAVKETNITTLARQQAHEQLEGLFDKENEMHWKAEQVSEYKKAVDDLVIDIYAEQIAKHKEDVGTTSLLYKELRDMFTEAFEFVTKLPNDYMFVHIRDIVYALRHFKQHPEYVLTYREVFRKFVIDNGYKQEEYSKKAKEIERYFNEKSYLVKGVDIDTVDAIIGFLLFTKKQMKAQSTDNLNNFFYQEAEKYVDNRFLRKLKKFYTVAANTSPNRTPDEIAQYITGMSITDMEQKLNTLDPKKDEHKQLSRTLKNIRAMIQLSDVINNGMVINYQRFVDTYSTRYANQREMKAKETPHGALRMYLQKDVNELETELKTLEKKLGQYETTYISKPDAEKRKQELEAQLQEIVDEIKKYEEEILEWNKIREQERNALKEGIFYASPELIETYIITRNENIEEGIQKRKEEKDKLFAHIKEEYRSTLKKEYEKRKKFFKYLHKYTTAPETILYRRIKNALEKDPKIIPWKVFKNDIDVIGYKIFENNKTSFTLWYDKREKLNNAVNKVEKENRKPFYIEQGRYKNDYSKTLKKIYNKEKKLDEEILTMEALFENTLSYEDIQNLEEDELRKTLVDKALKDLFVLNRQEAKTKLQEFYKHNVTPSALSQASKQKRIKEINEESIRIEEKINKLKKVLKEKYKVNYDGRRVENIKLEIKGKKGEKKIVYLFDEIRKYTKYLDQNEKLIKALENVKGAKESFKLSLNAFASTHDIKINSEGYETILRYLSKEEDDDNFVELHKTVKKLREDQGALVKVHKETTKEYTEVKEYTETISEKIENIKKEIKEKETAIKISARKEKRWDRLTGETYKYGNSNLGTFKNIYKIDNDEEALAKIIELSAPDYDGNLEDVIKKAGLDPKSPVEVHNDVVDILITRLNYLAMYKKTNTEEFYVFDMETIEDDYQQHVPYQMSLLHNKNGKFTIFTGYFNNKVFLDFKDDKATDEKKMSYRKEQFYKEQRNRYASMYNKDVNNEDDVKWMDARTTKLINRMQRISNEPEFVEVFFKHIASANDIPLVTHNGTRFDLPNFKNFLYNISKRMLANIYYKELRAVTKKSILAKLEEDETYLVDTKRENEILDELDIAIKKIQTKLEHSKTSPIEMTLNELEHLERLIKERTHIKHMADIKRIEDEMGFIIPADLKKEIAKEKTILQDKIKKYINGNKRMRKEIIEYFKKGLSLSMPGREIEGIEEFAEKLLKQVEENYINIKSLEDGYEQTGLETLSRRRRVMTAAGVKESEPIKTQFKQLYDTYELMITTMEENKKFLEATRDTGKETLKKLEKEKEELSERHKLLEEKIDELEDNMKTKYTTKQEAHEALKQTIKVLDDLFAHPFYQSMRIISSKSKEALKDREDIYYGLFGTAFLENEARLYVKQADEILKQVKRILNEIDKGRITVHTETEKELWSIKTEEERNKLITKYENKLTNLKSYLQNQKLTTETEQIMKDIKTKARQHIAYRFSLFQDVWQSKETQTLLGNKYKPLKGDMYKYDDLVDYGELILEQDKTNPHYKTLLTAWKSLEKSYMRKFNRINLQFEDPNYIEDFKQAMQEDDFELEQIMLNTIRKEINHIETVKNTLTTMDLTDTKESNMVALKYNQVVEILKNLEGVQTDLNNLSRFNLLTNRLDIGEAEQRKRAATKNDEELEDIQKKHGEHIKAVYHHPLEHADKYAFKLFNYDEEQKDKNPYIYRSTRYLEDDEIITVFVVDNAHQQSAQSFSYSVKTKQITFDLEYHYTENLRYMSTRPSKYFKFKYEHIPNAKTLDEWIQKFFDHKDGAMKGMKKEVVYKEKGVDSSFESIKALIKIAQNFSTEGKVKHAEVLKNTIDIDDVPLNMLKKVNITTELYHTFNKELELLQHVKNINSIQDMTAVYQGIAKKLLGKYNSTVPGKVLTLFPEQIKSFLVRFSAADLDAYGIDLINFSEGSGGATFTVRSPFSHIPLFRHNTNPIRTGISHSKLYEHFSAIKITNDLEELQEKNPRRNITEFIEDGTYKVADKIKSLLAKKTKDGKVIDAFTPAVTTAAMHRDYKDNVLHKTGINLPIAFMNLPQAFEDTIVMDKELAELLGWTVGNKTFLSRYGFKGAVQVREGIYDRFGAFFIAAADSVKDRGAYGASLEMALSNLSYYLQTGEYSFKQEVKDFIDKNETEILKYFELSEGKIIVDPNINYADVLEKLFTDISWKSLIQVNIPAGEYFEDLSNGDSVKYKYAEGTIERGNIYVIMDSEHTAQAMESNAEFDFDYGDVTVDDKGSVKMGVVISPSVTNTMEAAGVDWRAAFPYQKEKVDLYAKVSRLGISSLINSYRKATIEETAEAIKEQASSHLDDLAMEYLTIEKNIELLDKNADFYESHKKYYELRLKDIDVRAKNKAQQNLVGTNQAYYKATFRKYEGIRQQFLADTTLLPGEIRLGQKGFSTLVNITKNWGDNKWLQHEDNIPEKEWKHITGLDVVPAGKKLTTEAERLQYRKRTFKTEEERQKYVERLNSFGVLQGPEHDRTYSLTETTLGYHVHFQKVRRYFGYILAIRSPVQDYKATPVMKVIGFHNHSAAETNPYIYGMMGADNDGDTYGMVAIGKEQYTHLEKLDATKETFYDTGYLKSVYNITNLEYNISQNPKINSVDADTSYTGKKTFVVSDSTGFKLKIRDAYTYDELHYQAFKELYPKGLVFKNYVTKEEIADAQKIFEKEINNKTIDGELRTYVNVIIRLRTKGMNTNKNFIPKDYISFDKLAAVYGPNKDEIHERYAYAQKVKKKEIDHTSKLTKEIINRYKKNLVPEDLKVIDKDLDLFMSKGSKELKEKILFNLFYDTIAQNTVTRVRGSKLGINVFGGGRKSIFAGSVISTLANVGKDPTGDAWNNLRDVKGNLTIESCKNNLFSESYNVLQYSKESFITLFPSGKSLNPLFYENNNEDLKKLLGIIYDSYYRKELFKKEMTELMYVLFPATGKTVSKNIANVLEHLSIYEEPVIREMVERLKKSSEPIPHNDLLWIKVCYFGKYFKQTYSLFNPKKSFEQRVAIINNLAEGYTKQHIIDRRLYKYISDQASQIIALAKHYGIDVDVPEFMQNYNKEIKQLVAKYAVRKIYMEEDRQLGIAYAMDSEHLFEGEFISDDGLTALKEKQQEKPAQVYAPKTQKDYENHMQKLIKEMSVAELFGYSFEIPTKIYQEVEDAVITIFSTLQKTKNISLALQDAEFNKAIHVMTKNNISSFRVGRVLRNAFTTYRHLNNIYFNKYDKNLSKDKIKLLQAPGYYYSLLLKLWDYDVQKEFEVRYKDHQEFLDFILNRRDLPIEVLDKEYTDVDGNRFNGRSFKVEEGIAIPDKYELEDIIREKIPARKYFGDITRELLEKLEMLEQSDRNSVQTYLNEYLKEHHLYMELLKDKEKEIEEGKKIFTRKEDIQKKLLNRYIFGNSRINYDLKKLNQELNKYMVESNEYEKLKTEKQNIEKRLYGVKILQKKLNKNKDFHEKSIDNTKVLQEMDVLINEYKVLKEKLEDQMLSLAFDDAFEGAHFLLNTKSGQTVKDLVLKSPQYLTVENVEQFYDQGLLNMHNYQTPFLTVAELWKKENDYDWDAMFKWYVQNSRFQRLTIVMKGFDDEHLLRRIQHFFRKSIEGWKEMTQKEKMKYYKKHYDSMTFNKFEDLISYMEKLNTDLELPVIKYKGHKYYGWDELTVEVKKHLHKKIKIQDEEKLKSYFETHYPKEKIPGISLTENKIFTKVDKRFKDLEKGKFITPTLKEIEIRSAKDLELVFKFMQGEDALIGFADMNSIMDAMDFSYRPRRFDGNLAGYISKMQSYIKLMMRFSYGFLFRNLTDTWNQLFSHMFMEQGFAGMLQNRKEIVRLTGETFEIYTMYESLSQERFLTLLNINGRYKDFLKRLDKNIYTEADVNEIKKDVSYFKETMENYVKGATDKDTDKLKRIEYRLPRAQKIFNRLNSLEQYLKTITPDKLINVRTIKDRKEVKDSIEFLMNIRFAEFFALYDNLKLSKDKTNVYRKKIDRIIERKKKDEVGYEDFKNILFEISAFMNTNAQLDVYRQETYQHIQEMIYNDVSFQVNSSEDLAYDVIVAKVEKELGRFKTKIEKYLFNPIKATLTFELDNEKQNVPIKNMYDDFNTWIESTARIAGYLFDRYLHNRLYNDTVNRSLKRWFNYGKRTHLELGLLADIPYLSFPIRSIDNWIERMLDPSYLRVMSDILDGVYGQYADEDGRYDKFTYFMMEGGWLPITKTFGLRIGNGAFDIQSILSETDSIMMQRRNPILRAVNTLLDEKEIVPALKQLATVGVITRGTNTIMPREIAQSTPVMKDFVSPRPRSFGSSASFAFDYMNFNKGYGYKKYTPKQYLNNSRYARYENIYKNWFNKYGRMRKPKVNPYSLVKDIQWNQYVRYRQTGRT
jgi:hypothetical protein